MIEVCADCGKSESTWASINRGVLLCHDCCSIHRSIGRHVSWVRSLHQGWWSPTLLAMVETVCKAGANSVWEHSILDQTLAPTGCRPVPTDSARLCIEKFIRTKHEDLEYILRADQDADGPEGLGAQLHAAARTPDLLTSLRLLTQGADPNFYHEEKGSAPLHVAAKSGQALQAELLLVHGADLDRRDSSGRTAEDVARDAGHVAIAERFHSFRYHAIDRLLQYLFSRKPGQGSSPLSCLGGFDALGGLEMEGCRDGRNKLQALSNNQFERLVADIYDEIDRREAGAVWLSSVERPSATDPAPFLPVHPELSATRNQGRQKLGRLTVRDFETLVRDILVEARRRDTTQSLGVKSGVGSPLLGQKLRSDISDDEPLYDSVASDDDYASTNSGELRTAVVVANHLERGKPINGSEPQNAVLSQLGNIDSVHVAPAEAELRHSLMSSAATIARLQSEIRLLQDQVSGLMRENRELKDEVSKSRSFVRGSDIGRENDDLTVDTRIRSSRPMSMYETRERLRNWSTKASGKPENSSHDVGATNWPSYEEVIARTNLVTKRIQELCTAMKKGDSHTYSTSSMRIRLAVGELTSIFPQGPVDDLIGDLNIGVARLEVECNSIQSCLPAAQIQCVQRIRNVAYDIAKATKLLVVKTQNNSF